MLEDPAVLRYSVIIMLCLATIPLLAIDAGKPYGWLLLAGSVMLALWRRGLKPNRFSKEMWLIAGMIALLGLIPIDTTITYRHILIMGSVLALTILIPYCISRWWLTDNPVTFPFGAGRSWRKKEIGYIVFAAVGSYLLLPYYLGNTGSYANWGVVLDPSHIFRLFLGTNALGIWDELFFVGVCLTLLRRHLPFWVANMAQATMWTTFLYELGFRGWGPLPIFLFTLSQGVVFKNTKSLLYVISVHLTIDFMLFLVLIHLHHPSYLNIFITSPF